mmetsp:Transcript_36390/g.46341  ORF Transcript_36390/g.46341 Transcript_36390/m.46341 type:complete len:288 (+) Transcript_36390:68-931(+)
MASRFPRNLKFSSLSRRREIVSNPLILNNNLQISKYLSKYFLTSHKFSTNPKPKYDTALKYEEFYNPKPEEIPTIHATLRTEREKGTKYSVKKRQEGLIPAVIYGKAPDNTTTDQTRILVNVPTRLIEQEYRKRKYSFEATLYDLELDGTIYKVLPRQFAVDPVIMPLEILSVNFLLYNPGRTKIPIPFDFINEEDSTAIKRGALVVPVNYHVLATCSDHDIPSKIQVDLSQVFVGQKLRLAQVPLPPNITPVKTWKGEETDLLIAVVQGKKGIAGEEGGDAATEET